MPREWPSPSALGPGAGTSASHWAPIAVYGRETEKWLLSVCRSESFGVYYNLFLFNMKRGLVESIKNYFKKGHSAASPQAGQKVSQRNEINVLKSLSSISVGHRIDRSR